MYHSTSRCEVILSLHAKETDYNLTLQHPSEKLHPEQTASILSRLIYTYMDPLIFSASRVEHLAADQLPPLPDYDQAENLIEDGLQVKQLSDTNVLILITNLFTSVSELLPPRNGIFSSAS